MYRNIIYIKGTWDEAPEKGRIRGAIKARARGITADGTAARTATPADYNSRVAQRRFGYFDEWLRLWSRTSSIKSRG